MSEEAIKKKLNKAKKKAVQILRNADCKVETTSNKIYCIDAYRFSEHRIIAIGIREVMDCQWFRNQIKELERLPNPAPQVTTKEMWIKEPDEHVFRIYYYRDDRWVDENFEDVIIFN